MALIACADAAFAYDNRIAVRDLNFTVEAGDYLCIAGENGSGKSTLAKGLLRLIKPTRGTVDCNLRPCEIGYLPQQTAARPDFPASAFEVALSGRLSRRGARPFYTKADKAVAMGHLRRLGMDEETRCFRELSGGQRQRVLLARAFCAAEKLLLLDEPAAGLDPPVIRDLYRIIAGINRETGVAVVMVTHDIPNAIQYADKILHLQNRQVFFGSTSEYAESDEGKHFLSGDDYA